MPRGQYKRKAKTEVLVVPVTAETKSLPRLVKCGKHYLNPDDVSCIKEAKKGLFIVKLKSEPNPEWPIWVEEADIGALIAHFEVTGDV